MAHDECKERTDIVFVDGGCAVGEWRMTSLTIAAPRVSLRMEQSHLTRRNRLLGMLPRIGWTIPVAVV